MLFWNVSESEQLNALIPILEIGLKNTAGTGAASTTNEMHNLTAANGKE